MSGCLSMNIHIKVSTCDSQMLSSILLNFLNVTCPPARSTFLSCLPLHSHIYARSIMQHCPAFWNPHPHTLSSTLETPHSYLSIEPPQLAMLPLKYDSWNICGIGNQAKNIQVLDTLKSKQMFVYCRNSFNLVKNHSTEVPPFLIYRSRCNALLDPLQGRLDNTGNIRTAHLIESLHDQVCSPLC